MPHLRRALRSLLRTPGFTATAVLTMALAIGACTIAFSLLQAVVLRPLPYRDADSLYNVWRVLPDRQIETPLMSLVKVAMLRKQRDLFADVAAVSWPSTITYRNGTRDPEIVPIRTVTTNLLPMLGLNPALGRDFSAQDGIAAADRVVLISHSFWRTRFGADPQVIGRTIQVEDDIHEIVGVAPAELEVAFGKLTLMVPVSPPSPGLSRAVGAGQGVILSAFYAPIARLAPNANPASAAARMEEIARRYRAENPRTQDAPGTHILRPLKQDLIGDANRAFWILAAGTGAVLLIACANVANLFLARIRATWRDVAVRFSLGASRATILRLFFLESALFSVAGAALGALFAWLGLRAAIALAGDQLPRASEVQLDAHALLFCLGVSVLSALLVCVYPAWLASRIDVQAGLKEAGRWSAGSGAGKSFREGLVAVQVGLSLALLSCAGLLGVSLYRLLSADLGFATEGRAVGVVNLPSGKYFTEASERAFFRRLESALEEAPELAAAGAVAGLPLSGAGLNVPFQVIGQPPLPPDRVPVASVRWATPGYFTVMGVRLREGRFLSAADRRDGEYVTVINETLAKQLFADGSALDKRLTGAAGGLRIVGVIRDVKTDIEGPVLNEAYIPRDQMTLSRTGGMSVMAQGRPGLAAEAIVPVIRRVLRELDPSLALDSPRTMEALVGETVRLRRLALTLLVVLAGVAVLFSAVGIYAVLAYAVAQRTPEIGIRMALGAQRMQIVTLVLARVTRIMILGLALGLVAVVWISRLIASLLYQVQPLDPRIIGAAVLLFVAVAGVACVVPSLRASRVDPLEALRSE